LGFGLSSTPDIGPNGCTLQDIFWHTVCSRDQTKFLKE